MTPSDASGKAGHDVSAESPEFLSAMEHVAIVLSRSFCFGYFDLDDIRQQARLFALEALPDYDGVRDLANFLFTHVRNRLLNFQRDKLRRNDPPCKACHAGNLCSGSPEGSSDGVACQKYRRWFQRQVSKAGIMQPSAWTEATDRRHCNPDEAGPSELAATQEVWQKIDERLPAEYRAEYRKMRDGLCINKARREHIIGVIRELLGLNGDGES